MRTHIIRLTVLDDDNRPIGHADVNVTGHRSVTYEIDHVIIDTLGGSALDTDPAWSLQSTLPPDVLPA